MMEMTRSLWMIRVTYTVSILCNSKEYTILYVVSVLWYGSTCPDCFILQVRTRT